MGAGEADVVIHARPRRPRTAPTLRAVAVLVLLAIALLLAVGAIHRQATRRGSVGPARPTTEVLGEQVSRAPVRPEATTTTSSTTTPAPTPAVVVAASVPTLSTTCADALAYLAAHQAPGFVDTCADGSALGHLGYTCAEVPGRCEGQRFVRIACPAPFVYMNEAHNSWVLIGRASGIDPYGQGTASEQAACASHR